MIVIFIECIMGESMYCRLEFDFFCQFAKQKLGGFFFWLWKLSLQTQNMWRQHPAAVILSSTPLNCDLTPLIDSRDLLASKCWRHLLRRWCLESLSLRKPFTFGRKMMFVHFPFLLFNLLHFLLRCVSLSNRPKKKFHILPFSFLCCWLFDYYFVFFASASLSGPPRLRILGESAIVLSQKKTCKLMSAPQLWGMSENHRPHTDAKEVVFNFGLYYKFS